MERSGSKTRNLLNNGDNLKLRDALHNPDSALYNRVIDGVMEDRGLGDEVPPSPAEGRPGVLVEMADQFDKQKAEEAAERAKQGEG